MNSKEPQVVDINEKYLFSLSQLSTAFGPARETITKRLKAADVMPSGTRSGHNVYHIGAASKAIMAGEAPAFEEIKDPTLLKPKDMLDYYRGVNEKRKFEQDSGLLVPVDDVAAELSAVVKICTRTLDIIPDVLEMKCGLSASEIELVENECNNARFELSEKLAE